MGDNQATKVDAKNGLSFGGFNIGLYVKNALKSYFLQKMENNQAAKNHEDATNDLRVGEIKIVLSVKNALYILVAWALVLFASISLMYWSCSVPKVEDTHEQAFTFFNENLRLEGRQPITGLENRVADVSAEKAKLLAVIPEWGPNFRITFDLKVTSFSHTGEGEWANVFHFTATGDDCCSPGDRVPGLWTNNRNYLHFSNRVGDNGNYNQNTPTGDFPTNIWRRVEIEQKFVAYQWRYSVLVEGIGTLVDVVNTKPGNWTDVSVYTSDPFFPVAQAVMRNFHYASKH